MARLSWVSLASTAFLFQIAWSQQLQGTSNYMPYLQLSSSCQTALNTSVACPRALGSLAVNGGMIDSNGTAALCVSSCYTSLQNAKSTIAGACKGVNDTIVYDGVAYPATFFADNYLFAYNVSCRTDKVTGQFCDPQLLAWSTQGYAFNTTQSCSDCWLGVQALQLSNPLGYDAGLATNFASLTSSCNATAYAFTSPTGYALNSTATTAPALATATPPSTCTGAYAVQATDTCNSVAQALNVSTYNLLYSNNLDLYCQNFGAAVNSSLCIPPTCNIYTWQALDTCASVVSKYPNMTIPQFLAWNGNFNNLCQNTGGFQGYQVCLSPPGGYVNGASATNLSTTDVATTAAPAPTNAATGTNRNCGLWYTVQTGDTCAAVSEAKGITLHDFYFLNPEITSNCSNLQLNVSYCVEAVGNIATYSGYSNSATGTITVPPNTFSSANTAIPTSTPTGYSYTSSQMPTASGTISGCAVYANFNTSSNANSDCSYVAFSYQVTTSQLLSWNPSLSSNLSTCALQNGYSYCVKQTNTTTAYTPNFCLSVNSSTIVSGTTSSCACYTTVHGYYQGSYLCSDIMDDYAITSAQLTAWNTWLTSNCDNNLYAGMNSTDVRPVCIGVNGTKTRTTSSSSTTTTTTTSSITTMTTTTTMAPTVRTTSTVTTSTTSMGPTASGETTNCQQYYTVQSGDSCAAIQSTYSITFQQFYAWNPSIGSNCQTLVIGYAYCVKGPAISTTSTSTTSTTSAAPTQSGIASNCNKYYTVASGDSCSAIDTKFNITFAQLYQWNPAIGNNCQSLWVGYSICVGVSS